VGLAGWSLAWPGDSRDGCDEDQDEQRKTCNDQHGLFGAAEFEVSGFEAAEFYPPADGHHWDCEHQEQKADVSDQAQQRNVSQDEECQDHAGHDLEVAGITAGLIDAAEDGRSCLSYVAVYRSGTERAWLLGGVDRSLQRGQGNTWTSEARLKLPAMMCVHLLRFLRRLARVRR
jgi:hypothetical protein